MSTVALVGPDGAGKTTVARWLAERGDPRVRYLYMGIDAAASNVALPTKQLRARFRKNRSSGGAGHSGGTNFGGHLWKAGRLIHRLADEWFRQVVCWFFEMRGEVVLFDRHFSVDFANEVAGPPSTWDRRLHRWILRLTYPRPDLIVVLDAPAQVLFDRKGESTVQELHRRRRALLRMSLERDNVVLVDATRPLDEVCEKVRQLLCQRFEPRESAIAPALQAQ